jgi:hypothetical protein
MDETQDLILGVLSGTQYQMNYPGIEAYVESIRRSGFSGRKVMIAWNLHPNTKDTLLRYGFEVIDQFPYWPSEPFFHARVRLVYEYLRDHHKEFRFVHWLDIKDLVVQSNPSVWLEDNIGNHSIIGSSESVSINHEETNWMWANQILGSARANEIKDFPVLNGGTFSGRAEAMKEVFYQVHLLCKEYKGGFPPCQICMAYVLNTMFKDVFYVPSWKEGYACCTHPVWSPWRVPCYPYMRDKHPVLDLSTAVLYPGEGAGVSVERIKFHDDWHGDHSPNWGRTKKLEMIPEDSGDLLGIACIDNTKNKSFSILHGYDRDWTLKQIFEYKYRFIGDFDLNKFKEEQALSVPLERRGLRAVKRSHVQHLASSGVLSHQGRIFRRH